MLHVLIKQFGLDMFERLNQKYLNEIIVIKMEMHIGNTFFSECWFQIWGSAAIQCCVSVLQS